MTETVEEEGQLTLSEALTGSSRKRVKQPPETLFSIAKLEPWDAPDKSSPIYRAMVESIKAVGVMQAVAIVKDGGKFYLKAGRRRTAAALDAGLTDVPAHVYVVQNDSAALLTLIENYQRQVNPKSELHAIETLQDLGYDEDTIVGLSGMPRQTFRYLTELQNLIKPLRRAYDAGKIPDGNAFLAAKLDPAYQKDLVPVLRRNGTITAADITGVKRAQTSESMEALQEGKLFETPPLEIDRRSQTLNHLNDARKAMDGWATQKLTRSLDRLILAVQSNDE